jgi:hypothetical protein
MGARRKMTEFSEAHNRRPVKTTIRDIKKRAQRRAWARFTRTWVQELRR